MSLDLKHTEASFLPRPIDSLYLRVAEMPRCRDLAIFVRTTDDRQTDYLTPAAHARTRGNDMTLCIIYQVTWLQLAEGVHLSDQHPA